MKNQKHPDAEDSANVIQWDTQKRPLVPDFPVIPFIEGDGIGPDIWAASKPVLDAAVEGAYADRKSTRLNSSHTDISRMPSSA